MDQVEIIFHMRSTMKNCWIVRALSHMSYACTNGLPSTYENSYRSIWNANLMFDPYVYY